MKLLNTIYIEEFLEKAKIAAKTNQKNLQLSHKEYTDLATSLGIVMTRLSGELEKIIAEPNNTPVKLNLDGGKF
jgi:hypothetical protein